MFYEGREQVSHEWMRRMKQSLMYVSPRFDCRRMVGEYMSELYNPANSSWSQMKRSGFGLARELAHWNARVREVWDKVRFVELGPAPVGSVTSGRPVPVRTSIDLAGLTPADVRVEVVVGRVGTDGSLEDTEVMILPPIEQHGPVAVFGKEILPERTGKLGYALRVSPNHCEDPLTRPCTSLLKWSPA
jgi:starch phosphorylase